MRVFALAALALSLALAATAQSPTEPTIKVTDGDLYIAVENGKKVTFSLGESAAPVVLPDTLNSIKSDVADVRTATSSNAEGIEALRTAMDTTTANLEAQSLKVAGNTDSIRGLRTDVDTHTASLDTQGRKISANTDTLAAHTDSLTRVQRDVDLSGQVYSAILRAFDSVNNSTAAELRSCRTDVATLTQKLSETTGKLSAAESELKTTKDALAAAQKATSDMQGAIQVNNFISGQLTPDCPSGLCNAAAESNVRIFARGTFFVDTPGIYTCVFTSDAYNNHVFTTSAVAKYFVAANPLLGMYEINCKTPKYFDKDVPAATWTTTLAVQESGKAIPYLSVSATTRISFVTTGPTAAPIADQIIETETLKDLIKYPDGSFPIVVDISDADSAPTSIKMVVNTTDQAVIADNAIVISGSGAQRIIRVKPVVPANTFKTLNMNVTLTDEHARSRSIIFKITTSSYYNRLLFNLNPAADAVRVYHDTDFWTSASWVFNDGVTSPLGRGDIKTSNYFRVPLGPVIKMVAHMSGTVFATAYYNVRAAFVGKTLQEIIVGAANTVFADKDVARSTATTPKPIASRFFVDANGNQGQERGDPFFDFDDNLMANVNAWACAQINLMRLGTDRRVGSAYGPITGNCGGHVYTGLGGAHQNQGWCIAFEAQPIIGYCPTYNRYGVDVVYPPFGGCTNHPYISPCTGDMRNTPLNIAMFSWGNV